EVREPVWRRAGLGRLADSAVASALVLDHQVRVRALLERARLPAEEVAVEGGGRVDVGRAQLVPAEGPGRVDQLRAAVLTRLPDHEECAPRVLDHGHAAGLHHVEGRRVNGRTEL